MKTAILISGNVRTFKYVFKNQWWFLFRHYPDAYVVASVVADENAEDIELLRERYANDRISIEKVEQPDCLNMCGLTEASAMEAAASAPFRISSLPQAILRQIWHLHRVYQMAIMRCGLETYERFIRVRPDLHFHRFEHPLFVHSKLCTSPWWGCYGGINDRVAILGHEAAKHYFRTWEKVPQLLKSGCPLHPESLIAASLELGGSFNNKNLAAEFSAVRPSGQLVFPDMQLYDLARLATAQH